jgi:hypothetical protein
MARMTQRSYNGAAAEPEPVIFILGRDYDRMLLNKVTVITDHRTGKTSAYPRDTVPKIHRRG